MPSTVEQTRLSASSTSGTTGQRVQPLGLEAEVDTSLEAMGNHGHDVAVSTEQVPALLEFLKTL